VNKNTKILVLGFGITGISATKYLLDLGFSNITLNGTGQMDSSHKANFIAKGVHIIESGHDEIELSNVDLIVKSPGIKLNSFLQTALERNIPIWTDIELVYNTKNFKYIAISGTNGKTTTATITYELLRQQLDNIHLCGNIGIPVCDVAMTAREGSWLVCELSSFQLEFTDKFTPDIYILTNLTSAHLDHHKTLENYQNAKLELLKRGAKEQSVIYFSEFSTLVKSSNPKYKLVEISSDCDTAKVSVLSDWILIDEQKIIKTTELSLVGKHNLKNYLQAIKACLIALDGCINLDILRESLKTQIKLEHRMEFLLNINNVSIYNDAKSTNVLSLKTALECFDCNVTLICGGFDRGENYDLLKPVITNVRSTFIVGNNADIMAKTLPNATVCDSLEEATLKSLESMGESEILLFSPGAASYDQFNNYIERGNAFKEIIKGCLINN